MAMPLGGTEGASEFSAGDVTGSRALDTSYTNGSRRRLCFVTVVATAGLVDEAFAGYQSVLGGSPILVRRAAGLPAGLAVTMRSVMVFPVDPYGAYEVISNVGAGGALAINKWLEVDL